MELQNLQCQIHGQRARVRFSSCLYQTREHLWPGRGLETCYLEQTISIWDWVSGLCGRLTTSLGGRCLDLRGHSALRKPVGTEGSWWLRLACMRSYSPALPTFSIDNVLKLCSNRMRSRRSNRAPNTPWWLSFSMMTSRALRVSQII